MNPRVYQKSDGGVALANPKGCKTGIPVHLGEYFPSPRRRFSLALDNPRACQTY